MLISALTAGAQQTATVQGIGSMTMNPILSVAADGTATVAGVKCTGYSIAPIRIALLPDSVAQLSCLYNIYNGDGAILSVCDGSPRKPLWTWPLDATQKTGTITFTQKAGTFPRLVIYVTITSGTDVIFMNSQPLFPSLSGTVVQ
jgi:hypothetical protein